VFCSVRELEPANEDYIEATDAESRPLRRTKTAAAILASILRFCLRMLEASECKMTEFEIRILAVCRT
jgi:hypothetical protein